MQNTIGVICDCDETLTPDTTTFLLENNGIESKKFWKDVERFIQVGWDPPMAWMRLILKLMKEGKIKQDSIEKLRELGGKVKPFDGVLEFVPQIRKLVSNKKYKNVGIGIEFYIISSGIEDLIEGTPFAKYFTDIFGSKFFEEESTKKISEIKSIVSFTEKTKFLYAINKGIPGDKLRSNPFLVNIRVKKDKRRIPFENIIYIGDSVGDVPCFSAIKHFDGDGIGILTENNYTKGFTLAKERRSTVGPYKPDYREGSDLRLNLDGMVTRVANKILRKCKV